MITEKLDFVCSNGGFGIATQIPIRVVGEINGSCFVGCRKVFKFQIVLVVDTDNSCYLFEGRMFIFELTFDNKKTRKRIAHLEVAWEALVTVRGFECEFHTRISVFLIFFSIPNNFTEIANTSMKGIWSVVHLQSVSASQKMRKIKFSQDQHTRATYSWPSKENLAFAIRFATRPQVVPKYRDLATTSGRLFKLSVNSSAKAGLELVGNFTDNNVAP
jgi:hypothetical protein